MRNLNTSAEDSDISGVIIDGRVITDLGTFKKILEDSLYVAFFPISQGKSIEWS